MANQYGINLGEVYRDVEAIKGSRTRNKLAQLQLSDAERQAAERPEKERLAKERRNMLSGLRQKAVTGDQDASRQLLALDPEGGASFIDAVSKMDDRAIKSTKRNVDEIGQLSAYVLQGKTPEEQQRRYQLMYQGVSPEAQSRLPENYDPQFVELSLSKAMAMDKILENPKAINMGDKGELWKSGRKVGEYSTGKREDRQSREKAASIKANKLSGSLKSGDESLMYRQSAELLGGMFDQSGNLTNLDPNTRNKVQAIATEAANIFASEGNITRSEAVKRAAKAYGLNVEDAPAGMPDDPLGIR